MTLENIQPQLGMVSKQLVDRYAEYPGPAHDQPTYYPYEPAPPSHSHVVPLPSKHHFGGGGGGHKNNAAMSALTLLAFLFFLHILQQCLKEHMTALNTPQVMIMTGGKEGEENIARVSHKKLDKTGVSETENDQNKAFNSADAVVSNDNSEKYFTKITSSGYDAPLRKVQNHNINLKYTDFV